MKLTTILPAVAALILGAAPASAKPNVSSYWTNVVGANTPGAFIASHVLQNNDTGWRMNIVYLLNCNNKTQSYVHARSLVTVTAPLQRQAASFGAERGYA